MIEVFKTNVNDRVHADKVLQRIHESIDGHEANFDLHDIDRILRIRAVNGRIHTDIIVGIVKECGFIAEVL